MMFDLVNFFTRLPTGRTSIERAARQSYLLPLLGMIVGALVGIFNYCIATFADRLLATLFTLVFLYALTGLTHLDGMADFADGVYTSGDKERKITAMKDIQTGIAGTTSVIFVILFSLCTIYALKGNPFKFIVAEICAKTAMLSTLFFGKPMEKGLGKLFIGSLNRKAFPFSLLFSLTVSFAVLHWRGLLAVLASLLSSLIIVKIGHRNFGGINGDVIGAANEMGRIASLLVLTFPFEDGFL